MDVDDPFDQESARSIFNLSLYFGKVVSGHLLDDFFCAHVVVDVLGELRQVLGIAVVELIAQGHLRKVLLLISFHSFLEDGVH